MTAELYSGSAARGKTKGELSAIYEHVRARQKRAMRSGYYPHPVREAFTMRIAKNEGATPPFRLVVLGGLFVKNLALEGRFGEFYKE